MSPDTMPRKFGHAVIIGSSVAGLLAARVLAESFARVTVLERDKLPAKPESRKGAPQTRHTHAMLKAGVEIMEELFPHLWDEMMAVGSVQTDLAGDLVWFHHGVWKNRQPANVITYSQTRPAIDWHLIRRLKAHDNVELVDECRVASLSHDGERARVTGVHVKHKDGREEALVADLVVDASGRGTKSPRWLDELGYGRPPVEEIKVDIGYSTLLARLPSTPSRDWKSMIILPKAPKETKGGYIFQAEDNQWTVSLAGYLGDYPPADEAGFWAFAKQLPRSEYYETIQHAEPLTPIVTHRVPSTLRRYYEKMPRFPEGYLVVGDAACSMNPVFGQGMSMAALAATALRQQLAEHPPGELFVSRRFAAALAKYSDVAWLLAAVEDLRYPQVTGERFPGVDVLQWYIGALLELGAVDPRLNSAFLDVVCFTKPLSSVLSPSVLFKVLRWSLGLDPRRPSGQMPRAVTAKPAAAQGLGVDLRTPTPASRRS